MKYSDWFKKEKTTVKKINEEKEMDCPACDGQGVIDGEDCEECGGLGVIDDDEADAWYGEPKTAKPAAPKKDKDDKEEKKFEVGDVLVLVDNKPSSKMPADAFDFLQTYKTFKVLSINDKGKINLGCRISKNEAGKGVEKIYMFSTSRFEKETDYNAKKEKEAEAKKAEGLKRKKGS